MNTRVRHRIRSAKGALAVFIVVWMSVASPAVALAQGVDASGNPTGATGCTGASCTQGMDQGLNQGTAQGGPTIEELGGSYDENGEAVLPEGVQNTTQGGQQGLANGTTTTNSGTGADSNNSNTAATSASTTTGINNTATDTTTAAGTANTGGNASNQNSGNAGVTSGNAGIGVTQVKNDNTAVVGGQAGLTTSAHNGNYVGDLNLGFGSGTADLSGGSSVRATNETTGSNSTNANGISSSTEEITEVQNDGQITNALDLSAITGRNSASENTGDGSITTGDANVAATLINLLNSTVINGDLWVTVVDMFGDLDGNINIPALAQFLSPAAREALLVQAANNETGSNSTNTIDVDVNDQETTRITNDADVETRVTADAITGQNEAAYNTGGAQVTTGDAHVSAGNVTVANTTVEGGNWGLFIVNALNTWLGFLVGENGEVRALSQDETIRQIEAQNTQTGSDSTNTTDVDIDRSRTTTVTNNAQIDNDVHASAITGQNEASKNTGSATVATGDANVQATAVNIANTTVKDGSLFIAVVNIFGDWFGDLLYGGQSLAQASAGQGPAVTIDASNTQTGSDSTNEIDVNVDRSHETTIDNEADVETILTANLDTGNNRANRNTGAAQVDTGDSLLALHARNIANLTGIADGGGLAVSVTGNNEATGFSSHNVIRANINDERAIDINNDANVSTVFNALANTGLNEASQNTGGGAIETGTIWADVAIQNLVNRVLLALAHDPGSINVDALNRLTGAESENVTDVHVLRDRLLGIINDATIDNLINLLFNTGGNKANENTGGGDIATGAVCVDGKLVNEVNGLDGSGKKTASAAILDRTGTVNNQAEVTATTGNNDLERNTQGGQAGEAGDCEKKVAVAPQPTPTPGPAGGGPAGGAGSSGESGIGGAPEGEVTEEKKEGRVAAAISKPTPPRARGGQILQRFPVAGAESLALLLQGKRSVSWTYFIVAALGMLGIAWHYDQKARQGLLYRQQSWRLTS